jgi:hypothetical protein
MKHDGIDMLEVHVSNHEKRSSLRQRHPQRQPGANPADVVPNTGK